MVEYCFRQHINHPDKFARSPKNGKEDQEGVDFTLIINGTTFKFQVKTCNRTLGLILPISAEVAPNLNLSDRMWTLILEHTRKHAEVKYFLFVARVTKFKKEPEIIEEIRRETTKLVNPEKIKYKLAS